MLGRGGRTAAAVIAALLLTTLTACTRSATQPKSVPSAQSESASAKESSSAPKSPEAEGLSQKKIMAQRVISYYRARNKSLSTGRVSALEGFTTTNCTCIDFSQTVAGYWSSGKVRVPEKGFYQSLRVIMPTLDSSDSGFVTVTYHIGGATILTSAGRVKQHEPANSRTQADSLNLEKQGSVWRITQITHNT